MVWKISRVMTWMMIDCRRASGLLPAINQRGRRGTSTWTGRGERARRRSASARRKIRLATPVAATTSTAISPIVSQARMSTGSR